MFLTKKVELNLIRFDLSESAKRKTKRGDIHKGSCTYYVITDRGGGRGVSPNDYSITEGGSSQMITVLLRGGPPNDYDIT